MNATSSPLYSFSKVTGSTILRFSDSILRSKPVRRSTTTGINSRLRSETARFSRIEFCDASALAEVPIEFPELLSEAAIFKLKTSLRATNFQLDSIT